jgi:hypothetical protein
MAAGLVEILLLVVLSILKLYKKNISFFIL